MSPFTIAKHEGSCEEMSSTHHWVDAVSLLERAEQSLRIAIHGAFEEDGVDHLALTSHGCQSDELRHF